MRVFAQVSGLLGDDLGWYERLLNSSRPRLELSFVFEVQWLLRCKKGLSLGFRV